MTTVLVPLDQGDQPLRPATLEVLTLARDLGEVTVLAFAEPGEELLTDLGRYGVGRVLVTQLPEPATSSALVGQAVASAVRQVSGAVVLLPSTFTSKEVAAHAAHHLQAGLLIDVGDLRLDAGRLVGGKRVFGGTWETECAATTEVAVATVRPNAVLPTAATTPATPQVQPVTTEAAAPAGLELLERQVADHSGDVRPALAEAAIVVAGGRGTFGDFEAVEELADVLGGAIGTTRDCVDEGWLPHEAQVGQTGTTIAPRVYIGAGISGAPHHVGGMSAAGTVIAVNLDDEAPLVQLADFAVIGDLSSVLADAAEALRAYRDER
ncbi:electron transfer flavoprotein subunit alpha/FixB family protein [Ruania zhangjianzhongii]|uniref:electron transfer flavoprotein subunit alpha/FixB family protein n=1 Tax=Ruania zhangjianzhongii TaxID=2603206 RepID=UPI0011C752CC|nr:electron transfer flavoprotein subunit alpha/FixB family protein [Ruania zhangjianzhongii]